MKKTGLFFLFLFCLLAATPAMRGQTGLRVDSLFGFPQVPVDTIHANHIYTGIDILIHNYSTSPFTGSIEVYLSADSLLHIDTLRSDSVTIMTLAPGADTTIHADSLLLFEAANYAAGDNIVVVWPSLRIAFPVDSTYIHIYFDISTGLDEPPLDPGVRVWPVPARQLLRFEYTHREAIEQVRIFDVSGKLVFSTYQPPASLDVSDWPDGLYFVLLTRTNGSQVVKKLLKQ